MARKVRIAFVSVAALVGLAGAGLWTAYFAARQVRPFYHKALELDPVVLEAGGRELESRASALYSDTRDAGQWHAQFTAEQINGWLATQLKVRETNGDAPSAPNITEPRVAITPGILTLGFGTSQGGIETIVSVDAAVSLTEEGAIAIQLKSVRAGALPLPALQVADEIAAGCRELDLPVRWTQSEGEPIAIIEVGSETSSDNRQLHIDAIELNEGELYVVGHTVVEDSAPGMARDDSRKKPETKLESGGRSNDQSVELSGYELRLAPEGNGSVLEISRDPRLRPADTNDGAQAVR